MKFKLFNAGLFLLLCVGAAAQQPSSKASYVDPFIGTDGMGHTFPGACVPFGGVQLSPDTDTISFILILRRLPAISQGRLC